MKKFLKCLACVVVFLLMGCANTSDNSSPNESVQINPSYTFDHNGNIRNYFDTLDRMVEQGENYKIYTDSSQSGYYYTVTDRHGNCIDFGYHNWRCGLDFSEKYGLLCMEYVVGGPSWLNRYYDIDRGFVSPFFEMSYAGPDNLIAYFNFDSDNNTVSLIVRDAFNADDFYKEIQGDFPDSVFREAVDLSFINSNEIQIKFSDTSEGVKKITFR